jgi:DNA-directed RNA polymerase subunit RPC12/RpoP
MKLDDAIKHCEEVAKSECNECGKEHRQLTEWLKDYKRLKEQEPSDDAISRSEITSKIEEWADGFENGEYFSGHSVADAIRVCSGMADELPSVMPLHKKGKWIKEYDNSALDGLYHCSICGRKLWIHNEESVSDYPYCHCGAEMESENEM